MNNSNISTHSSEHSYCFSPNIFQCQLCVVSKKQLIESYVTKIGKLTTEIQQLKAENARLNRRKVFDSADFSLAKNKNRQKNEFLHRVGFDITL